MTKAAAEKAPAKATKTRRKSRTIEEQIADLKAKAEAQAKRERDRLSARQNEAKAREDRYKSQMEKAKAEREEIEAQIEALTPKEHPYVNDADAS